MPQQHDISPKVLLMLEIQLSSSKKQSKQPPPPQPQKMRAGGKSRPEEIDQKAFSWIALHHNSHPWQHDKTSLLNISWVKPHLQKHHLSNKSSPPSSHCHSTLLKVTKERANHISFSLPLRDFDSRWCIPGVQLQLHLFRGGAAGMEEWLED